MATKILPVPHIEQEQTLWCWAANVDMVSDFYYRPPFNILQCEIARDKFGFGDCDAAPGTIAESSDIDSTINEGVEPEDVKSIWADHGVDAKFLPRQLTFAELKHEIDEGRPVQVAWLWAGAGGGGHVVIIRGYKDAGEVLYINDPLEELDEELDEVIDTVLTPISYSDLQTAGGQGTWAYTWRKLKRIPGFEPHPPIVRPGPRVIDNQPTATTNTVEAESTDFCTITVQIQISEE